MLKTRSPHDVAIASADDRLLRNDDDGETGRWRRWSSPCLLGDERRNGDNYEATVTTARRRRLKQAASATIYCSPPLTYRLTRTSNMPRKPVLSPRKPRVQAARHPRVFASIDNLWAHVVEERVRRRKYPWCHPTLTNALNDPLYERTRLRHQSSGELR